MSRLLLHPLTGGGNITRVPPGRWTELKQPDLVNDVELTEAEDRTRRGRIASVPSPWARLRMFADAVESPEHPFHDEALNDVLDTLELVLFHPHLAGVHLATERVELADVSTKAAETQNQGVRRFAEALRDLAPVVDRGTGEKLSSITVVRNGAMPDAPILFATSPFTLFFTPETRRASVPGYFTGPGPLRPLSARPPALARYVRQRLVPQLGTLAAGGRSALQKLSTLLAEQARVVAGSDRPYADNDPSLTESSIQPAPGLVLHTLVEFPGTSGLGVAARRQSPNHPRPPLVLDNSGRAVQERYFPWLPRPVGTTVDPSTARDVLPSTSWKHEWLYPETDFLVDKLLVLDAPLVAERIHSPAGDAQGRAGESQRLALRILVPLKPKFFEFFRAEDVGELLDLRVTAADGGAPRVQVTLTVPTGDGPVTVQRSYASHAHMDSHLSLWPGFKPKEGGTAEWRDYYLMHHMEGGDARDEVAVELAAAGSPVVAQEYQRVVDTVLYHFAAPPEVIHLKGRHAPLGDARVAEGVVLPRLKPLDAPTNPPWTIAIDFGTSNTTVAYREEGAPPQALTIREAARFDLTQTPAGEGGKVIPTYFDSFFFPLALEPRPFGTVIYRSRGVAPDSDVAQIPALTANVPFRGEVIGADAGGTSSTGNQVAGDLKWGGAGADSERLTKLFLHQVLLVVYAEALGRGVKTDGFEFRWSYPIAFSGRRQRNAAKRWQTLLEQFRTSRFRASGAMPAVGAGGQRPNVAAEPLELDESTASLLYFTHDPTSEGQFGPYAENLKLTADVGGGTTDVAARARGRTLFLTSALFGGRDLIAGPEIYKHVQEWAVRRGLPPVQRAVLEAYPTSHTRFNYLVRLPWFAQNASSLASEEWFPGVQVCILYFFGAILYNLGVRLRAVTDDDVAPADMLYFAGNGSSYLSWLTEFEPWNRSSLSPAFADVLQGALEAGYGKPLGHQLAINSSNHPKQEVALGLLLADSPAGASGGGNGGMEDDGEWGGGASRGDAGAARPAQPIRRARAVATPTYTPVGEAIALPNNAGTLAPEDGFDGTMLPGGAGALRYALPFDQWEITKYNQTFARLLPTLAGPVDPAWREYGARVTRALEGVPERFFKNAVPSELDAQLKEGNDVKVSLFIIEARMVLRELERRLLG